MSEGGEQGGQGAMVDWMTRTFDPWLESRKHSNRLIIFFCLLAAIPIIGIGLATTRTIRPHDQLLSPRSTTLTTQAASPTPTGTAFDCAQGKSLTASFSPNAILLSLPDGRILSVPRDPRSPAIRFSNADGSFVVEQENGILTVREDGELTYADCMAKS